MQRPDMVTVLSCLDNSAEFTEATLLQKYVIYLERIRNAAYKACERYRTCGNLKVFCEDSATAVERLSDILEELDNAKRQ